jgi:hypothetical protein
MWTNYAQVNVKAIGLSSFSLPFCPETEDYRYRIPRYYSDPLGVNRPLILASGYELKINPQMPDQ